MKRLLIYSDCYVYGGSERLMSSIIRSQSINAKYEVLMAYRTHQIYEEGLAAEYSPAMQSRHFIPLPILANDTLFYRLGNLGISKFVLIPIKTFFWTLQKTGFYWLWNSIHFAYLLWHIRPDVLHINNGGYPGAKSCTQLALIASIFHPSKIVYQINNLAFSPKGWLERLVDARLIKHCQFLVASKFGRVKLISARSFPPYAITQIFNTAPDECPLRTRAEFLSEWELPENTIVLAHVAFLSARKGQRYLLDALHLLKSHPSNLLSTIVLFFVGDGEDAKELQHLCQDYGLESNVRFVGYRKDSIEYIAHSNLFLLPSIALEDMPLVVLSAMKYGKTIIASRFAGIEEEIEDGVSGILINPDVRTMAVAIAEAIQKQIIQPDIMLGERAKKRYEAIFSANVYAKSLLKLYGNLKTKDIGI
jgi:glycosyltransferase involved in cell wall biosynthesis